MKLEEEIKQKSFRSEYQKLIINLVYTGSWIRNLHADFFKGYDLTLQQFNILRILRGQYPQPASVNLLIERMLDKMSNASRLVDKLKRKGLVQREECEYDRRKADVVITKKGLELLEQLDKELVIFESKLENISEEEARQLNKLLDAMRG